MGHTHFEGAAASICPLIASGHFTKSVNGVAGAQSSLTLPLSTILSHGMTILQSVMRISSILFRISYALLSLWVKLLMFMSH